MKSIKINNIRNDRIIQKLNMAERKNKEVLSLFHNRKEHILMMYSMILLVKHCYDGTQLSNEVDI